MSDVRLNDLYLLASAAVCEGRNMWAEHHEENWLENDNGPDPDNYIGGFVVDTLFTAYPKLWKCFNELPATE